MSLSSTISTAISVSPEPTAPKPDARPWSKRAACNGKTSLFFGTPAERPEARMVRELKASLVCATCPVLTPCREWARAHGEYGYWGGESEEARAAAGFRTRMPRAVRRPRRINPHRVA
jgi:WhiB family transcriptional regulator, redox-sensing transcriptional regulator